MEFYTLEKYAARLREKNLLIEANLKGKEQLVIEGLSFDSREVKPGFLFVCKGAAFKEQFLTDAIAQGAGAYVSEKDYGIADIPALIVSDIRLAMPCLADVFFDSPQKKLTLIGVGGTKGKTSTSWYIKSILDEQERLAGEAPCGLWSSVSNFDGCTEEESHITTPESIELYRFLARAVDNGVRYFVTEVSSQALKYHRVGGLVFDIGIFLNIAKDHISPVEHQDFDDYFASKLSMFDQTKTAIVNYDSDHIDEVLTAAESAEKVITVSIQNPQADYVAEHIETTRTGSRFTVGDSVYETSILGRFNVENALVAIATAQVLGIDQECISRGVFNTKVEGRVEVYRSQDDEIIGIVDYAHNKLSFEKLFSSLKQEFPAYRIVAIFGAPGGKALQRREELGTVAAHYVDDIFLTAEDPGFERVVDICEEIGTYVKKENRSYRVFEERGDAIREAVEHASGKTLVVMTGKGNEEFQKVEGRYDDTISDVEYITQYLAEYDHRNE